MRRGNNIVKRIVWALAVLTLLCLCWSFAYLITTWCFHHIGIHVSGLLKQLTISLIGFILFGFIMYGVSRIGRFQEKQAEFFRPLITAMENMAQGNFNIDLSYYSEQNPSQEHPLGEIVESIKHMADELREMEQMRQEFISNVSHEIQSPLTSIRGFAIALQNNQLSKDERSHYLQIIETETMRLSKLSENLLKLTSLESDHPPFEPKNYRLDQQLRRVILACEPQWTNKNIDMDVSLSKTIINADEELMDQVWINLIHNSIKFTPEDGTISILINQDDEKVSVNIKDTGIGMTKEIQMHIFERFYKADQSRNRTSGGSGLGLSIVKKIIEMHHGTIQVASEPGNGTEFTVTLPKHE
ncbi:sensor histidine kinase [Heyndrickxia ginsengihumi]|uniref:histidine kinase n=1 Tax=Heyndrickxia ginsengihumi TaxID=363870 RepID=A0A0A6XVA7_9BACI|nr:HAMP domain-containing sensor histidine kinase [Heyndrickxia ginsengihumi]KHD84112.1 membrane protein [Heyndrickxia ginsengihumi]